VADVGAGSGLLTVHLARAVQPDGKVIATDIDARVLELLHSRVQAAGLAEVVEERVVGPETPGLEPGIYDAILLAEVDHHFADPVAWIKTAATSLKPTGRIVISNRVHHRAKSKDAAQKAGLELESETSPVPSHFVMAFTLKGAGK
jgi:2-polyprenyl-3-methyl-5-hydroxy-6-metoxy-1,4-benzoquinol methylase